jgi:hypothetical protein
LGQTAPAIRVRNASEATVLFDDLVGAGEQHRRDLNPEHPDGSHIDGELELGGLLDR